MKNTISMKIPYSIPLIEEDEIVEVVKTLKSNWLVKGPKTIEFEQKMSQFVNSKHSIGLTSCTSALHLAQVIAGIGPGDEVITTPYTFASTVNTIIHTGAKPVLVDIDPLTMNINPNLIEKKITKRTKAIIPVHFAGYPCEMNQIMDIAKKHHVTVIEDAAHAIYTKYRNKMVGSIGDMTCFSFYATKNLVTGVGGMLSTNNDEYASRARKMSMHGLSKNAWNRYSEKGSWYYEIEEAGYNYYMNDIQAALGLVQLEKLEYCQQIREKYAYLYNEAFKSIQGITLPYNNKLNRHAWHLYVIRIDENYFTINRDTFIEELKVRGVNTSVHFIPIPMHPYYKKRGYHIEDYPNAFQSYAGAVSLPLYPKMSEEDVYYVIEAVQDVAAKYRK